MNWVPGGAVGAARLGVAVAQRRRPLLAVLALEEPVGMDDIEYTASNSFHQILQP